MLKNKTFNSATVLFNFSGLLLVFQDLSVMKMTAAQQFPSNTKTMHCFHSFEGQVNILMPVEQKRFSPQS
jgi:hypothetical protein